MKIQKRIWKKAAALMMLSALVITMACPVYSYAEDETAETAAEASKETKSSPTEPEENEAGAGQENGTEQGNGQAQDNRAFDIVEEVEPEEGAEQNTPVRYPSVEGITIDKNGQFLQVGESTEITVNIRDGENLISEGEMIFASPYPEQGEEIVKLEYSESDKLYHGKFDATKDTYPCEWYLEEIKIPDKEHPDYGGLSSKGPYLVDYGYTYRLNYYVKVKDGDRFENPVFDVTIHFYELDKNGEWQENSSVIKKVPYRATVKEAGLEFPKIESQDPELEHVGWKSNMALIWVNTLRIFGSGNTNWSLYAEYEKKSPAAPSQTDKPAGSGTNSSSNSGSDNTTAGSDKKLSDKTITEIVKNIEQRGGVHEIDMNGATFVPGQLLESARGRDVTLRLNMGNYQWNIKGTDIISSNPQDIDLEVTMNTKNIPVSTIRELTGNNPYMQLSLTHNGNFGFQAELVVNVGAQYAGQFGNLYYYNSRSEMEFMNAGVVSADGEVGLGFSHASDYALVLSAQPMSGSVSGTGAGDVIWNQDSAGTGSAGGNTQDVDAVADRLAADGSQVQVKSVKTGDSLMLFPPFMCGICASGLMIYLLKKRKPYN